MENVNTVVTAGSESESRRTGPFEDPEVIGRLGYELRTVTVLLPLIHNPNKVGIRLPVSLRKIWWTIREIKRDFSGFTPSLSLGWCKDDGIWDLHLRVEIDIEITPDAEVKLLCWKEVLRDRFRQRAMYMRASAPIRWF
jgi:hypothetical protein